MTSWPFIWRPVKLLTDMLHMRGLPYFFSLVDLSLLTRVQSHLHHPTGCRCWKERYRSGSWVRMAAWRSSSAGGGDRTGYKLVLRVEFEWVPIGDTESLDGT